MELFSLSLSLFFSYSISNYLRRNKKKKNEKKKETSIWFKQ